MAKVQSITGSSRGQVAKIAKGIAVIRPAWCGYRSVWSIWMISRRTLREMLSADG